MDNGFKTAAPFVLVTIAPVPATRQRAALPVADVLSDETLHDAVLMAFGERSWLGNAARG
jgi:hypothetical protein